MSRGYRRTPGGALTLLLAGCFAPSGSVSSLTAATTSSSTSTTQASSTSTTQAAATTDASEGSSASGHAGTTTTGSATALLTTGPGACGDGVLDELEACDDGPANGDAQPCRSDCTLAVCGDGQVCSGCDPAETCDDGNLVDDDGCDRNCQRTACGDGELDLDEECDDHNQISGDGCSPRCLAEHQYLFLSSIKLPGDFNGPAAADLLCTGLAATRFNPRRKFVAWLSVAGTPAATRIGLSPFPYRRPTGVQVAASTQALLAGPLAVPVVETEDGMSQPNSPFCDTLSAVWTGTGAMGEAGLDCGAWNSSMGEGLSGNFGLTDAGWSDACNLPCAVPLRLYCIEKAL